MMIGAATASLFLVSGIGASGATAATGSPHIVDVIYVEAPDRPLLEESVIAESVQRIDEYWTTESEGLISGIDLGEVKRVPVPAGAAGQDVCSNDGAKIRTWATAQFGRTTASYNQSQGRHLLIIESTTACGHGVGGNGSLGASIASGGTIWLKLAPNDPSRWSHVLFHEFGHNLGLGHSNELVCADGRVDAATISADGVGSPNCTTTEYADAIDVMGGRFNSPGFIKEKWVEAPNVTDRVALGIFGDDDLRRLSASDGMSLAVDLRPSTDDSGIRGVEITDPVTGQKYYLEYRAGQGRDASTYYASSPADTAQASGLMPGVRVLRRQGDRESVVLNRPGLSDQQAAKTGDNSYVTGDVFLGYSDRLRVEVMELTPGNAALCVSFSAERPVITSVVPSVSGSGRLGEILTAVTGSWQPHTAAVSYQWLRNGVVIAGADEVTYLPTDADLGAEISVSVSGTLECFDGASSTSAPLLVTPVADGGVGSGTDGDADPGTVPTGEDGVGAGSGTPGPGVHTSGRDDHLAATGGAAPTVLLAAASALLLIGFVLQRRRRRL